MAPEEIVTRYVVQRRRRLAWFAVSVSLACLTAAVAKFGLDSAYPWWRLAILVWGLLYIPFFISDAYRKDHVFFVDAHRARCALIDRRREGR